MAFETESFLCMSKIRFQDVRPDCTIKVKTVYTGGNLKRSIKHITQQFNTQPNNFL